MMGRWNVIAIIALLTLLSACSERHGSYSDFGRIGPEGWAYGDTVKIRPEGLDSVMERSMAVAVRHTNDYPYRNLWLEMSYRVGSRVVHDTISMELADIYGRWKGRGFGPSYQMAQKLPAIHVIPDSTEIWIRHIMRVDTLRGIEQVGIEICSDTKTAN